MLTAARPRAWIFLLTCVSHDRFTDAGVYAGPHMSLPTDYCLNSLTYSPGVYAGPHVDIRGRVCGGPSRLAVDAAYDAR